MTTRDGSINKPYQLHDALTTWRIKPGHTIYLRGGVYAGEFTNSLVGTAEQPITICPYPNETAIIDGSLDINGAYTIWRDLEIRYSGWITRTSLEAGNVPSDLPRRDLNIYGEGTKLINCYIHDLSNFGWWGTAINSKLYGCLIHSNGWDAPDRGHGHGCYTQNRPQGFKVWKDCVTWGHYSTCGKVYSGSNAPLKHYDISGLICGPCGDSRFLVGSDDGSTEDVVVSNCMTYGAAIHFGDALITSDIQFNQLYIVSDADIPLVLTSFNSLQGFNNIIVGGNGLDPSYRVVCKIANKNNWALDGNTYYYTGPNTRPFRNEGIADYTFENWRNTTGLDQNSQQVLGNPTQNKIVVQPNMYDATRSHVAIWNWENRTHIIAPITGTYTSVLNPNETVAVQAGELLPMLGWSITKPIGANEPIVANTFPQFGCFQVKQ